MTAHETRFGFNIPGEIIEIVNFSATDHVDHPEAGLSAIWRQPVGDAKPAGHRSVMFPKGAWIRRCSGATPCARAIGSPVRQSSRKRPR